MTVDLKELKVNTNKERQAWIDLLYNFVNFHMGGSEEGKADILGDEQSKAMYMYHTSMANAVRDAITLIEMWDIEEEGDIKEI